MRPPPWPDALPAAIASLYCEYPHRPIGELGVSPYSDWGECTLCHARLPAVAETVPLPEPPPNALWHVGQFYPNRSSHWHFRFSECPLCGAPVRTLPGHTVHPAAESLDLRTARRDAREG